ncbi:MAG: phosphodiester glycosidase family protein [Anaerolineales bacterium]|nr:phosphodiester glycosidase family protein [Anaerolineales bacterium]
MRVLRVACFVLVVIGVSWLVSCSQPTANMPSLPIITATPTEAPLASPTLAQPAAVPTDTPLQTPAAFPTDTQPSPIPPTILPTPTVIPDSGWQLIATGREERTIHLFDERGRVEETIFIVRLDQTHYRFDVAYSPGEPKVLRDWQTETGAEIVVNGGFFDENDQATGRIIVNGQGFGTSYGDFAGMVAINENNTSLRWLGQRPYDPNEPLTAGLQSFPILVKPGGQLGFPAEQESGRRARRTVIAQDTSGRILLLVAPRGRFTLHELSLFLTDSDLELDIAINLDGGPSSGLLTSTPDQGYPPFVALPAVIAVYRR